MHNFDQLEENLRALSEPFSDRAERLLSTLPAYIRPLYCRICRSCKGVYDEGVPMADILRFLSYAEGYGEFAMAREQYLRLPAAVHGIRCRDCSSCSVGCPNGIEIRRRMIRAQELFA